MTTLKEQYNQYLQSVDANFTYTEWLEFEISKLKEEIAKIRNRKKPKMPNKKQIQQLRINDYSLMGEYQSISEASKLTGVNRVSISMHLSNPEKRKSAGGYYWRYKK